MKLGSILTTFALFAVFCTAAGATPIVYSFKLLNSTGAPVSGASIAIGGTTLTSNTTTTLTATTVPTSAGELVLGTRAVPGSTCSMTLIDYGTGLYSLTYDPATQGELMVPLTPTLAGNTFTPSTVLLVLNQDSSYISLTNTQTTAANQQTNNTVALTTQGYTTALASNLITTNTDVPLTYTQTSAANQQSNAATGVLGATAASWNSANTIGNKINSGGGGGGGSVTVAGYATGQDPATLLLNAALSSFTTTGSVGAYMNTASTDVPLIYTQTSAANQQANTVAGYESLPASHTYNKGKYQFNSTTNVITLYADDGSTVLGTVTLTLGGTNNQEIISRM